MRGEDSPTEPRSAGDEPLAAKVFQARGHAVVVTDARGSILTVNEAFEQTTGFSREEVLGKNPRVLQSGLHDAAFYEDLWETLHRTGVWEGEIVNRRKNGELYTERLTISALRGPGGELEHYVGLFTDISQRKEEQARIEHLAHHDALTELPNRLLLRKRAAAAFAQSQQSRRQSAVLFVDLDRFKDVNDSLGHDAGDLVLREVAQRLVGAVRVSDTVCRQGGDEFIVLLAEIRSPEDAGAVATKLLTALQAPFSVAGNDLYVDASVGVALFPDDGAELDGLLRRADAAMYAAKAAGRGRFHFYSSEMNARTSERRLVASDLGEAIERGLLDVAYQPHVELATGRVVALEALVRWNHAERGALPPARFLGVAEGAGLIAGLETLVLRRACRDVQALRAATARELDVAVNISGLHFGRVGFVETVESALRESGLPASALRLELREAVLWGRNQQATETARRLEQLGVRLAVDDFGTGYSNLVALTRLPVACLALDGALCQGLGTSPEAEALVRGIVGFARALGLTVRAKQIELPAQAAAAMRLGCDLGQGFHHGGPEPLAALAGVLAKSDARDAEDSSRR